MYAGVLASPPLDPVGEVVDGSRLPNGLDVRKQRVPLRVVAVVYGPAGSRSTPPRSA